MTSGEARRRILALVGDHVDDELAPKPFVAGQTPVPVAGRVFDVDDVEALIDASLDFWLTTGRYAAQFEDEFAQYFGATKAVLCNSGSSANLLAMSALTSAKLGDRRLLPGDEVITAAAGFPTTVNPIVQNRLLPVFVDVEPATYNIDVSQLEAAIGPRTRAIVMAHTLGNPFDLDAVVDIARRHGLWLIEDNCDALGSRWRGQLTGTFGAMATVSFYPAHHITMGEGGCVVTNRPGLRQIVESFRDWGRDCWCDPGKENTCGKRFDWQLGELPCGYDHKYIYSHVGYNLKLTDMQAAVGVSQLKKLPGFIETRKRNWTLLREGLAPFDDVLQLPEASPHADPSWFGFAISVRSGGPFTRNEVVRHLESRLVATRQLFAGNLVRQPAYRDVPHRAVGDLANASAVMNDSFWIGCYPGIEPAMVDYVVECFADLVKSR